METDKDHVTPYVGVWIETVWSGSGGGGDTVTPYVGVWIETTGAQYLTSNL